MANFFSRLFNTKKTTNEYDNPVEPYQSLSQVQGGPEYYKQILSRSQGHGVGFGDTYAQKYSNPIIQNMRGNFEDYTMPELNSELTATGRRRGSSGFQQIAQAQKEQGLAEGDIFSRLQQRNEDQSRSEINDAMGRVGQYAQNEADLRNNFSNFRMGIMDRRAGMNAQRNANESAGLNRVGQFATQMLFGGGSPVDIASPVSYGSGSFTPSTYPSSQNDYYSRLFSRTIPNQGQYGRVR